MRSLRIHLLLFLATVVTTFISGYMQGGDFISGISFSAALIFILGSHEMGHYFFGRRYGVDITPPYFIPAPPFVSPIGTFGAFIKIRSPIYSRKALFDIGVAGPIAGVLVAIPILYVGLKLSKVVVVDDYTQGVGVVLGSSPIFSFFVEAIVGEIPVGKDVLLHPIAFAGWIGLLVTAFNLIPSGQLDGGHIVYAVLGKKIHSVTSVFAISILVILGMGTGPLLRFLDKVGFDLYSNSIVFEGWPGWLVWAFFLTVMGIKHPPTVYEREEIGPIRKIIAFIAVLIFIGCFSPVPIKLQ